jgi:hypothetical protein
MDYEPVSDLYILDGHTPVRVPDVITWGRWFNGANRHVAVTDHPLFWVSTVFLGINHNFGFRGPPILFETMTFERGEHGGELEGEDGFCRYSCWDDAEAGHYAIVRRLTERAARAVRETKLAADLQRFLAKGEG